MSGSVAECVQHFLQRLDEAHFGKVADFVGASPQTIRDWCEGKQFPKGERALRLRVFLEAMGYELKEMRQIPAPALRMTRLIGYGAVELSQIIEELDYSEPHGLFRILEGGTPSPRRGYKLEMLTRDTDNLLRDAMQRCEDDLGLLRELAGVAVEPPLLFQQKTKDPVAAEAKPPLFGAAKPQNGVSLDSDTKMLMYLVLALDTHLRGMHNTQDAIERIRKQVSSKGRRVLQEFFDQLAQE